MHGWLQMITILLWTLRPPLPFKGKMTPELREQLAKASPDEKIFVIVHMKREYPHKEIRKIPDIKTRADIMREIAYESQKPLIEWLKKFPDKAEVVEQFWVFNGFHLKATKDIIEEIAKRDDIWFIGHNRKIQIPMPKIIEDVYNPPSDRAVEWNIKKVMADSCWNAGFTGQNVYIGHIDTGCDVNHPALQGNWSGYWKDVVNGNPNPYDDNNPYYHGTHTSGTIAGGDGLGSFTNDIGVAPEAKLVICKAFDSSGSAYESWLNQASQWFVDLKSNQGVDIKAISNSWGASDHDPFYWDECETWKSLDIFPVFAAGNSGPGTGTCYSPGDYPIVIGVGATDNNDQIADFSSRGPAPNQNPWNDPNNWYRDDWNRTKPDISAPGVDVRSAKAGGGYQSLSGTSMATPHVAGAVAILCQKNPNLIPEQLYNILLDNADPTPGGGNPNNTYGWGRLNVWKALKNTPSLNQPWISVISKTLDDPPPGGNGNGQWEPGETVQMIITIKNIGGAPGYNTVAKLRSRDNYVTVENGTYNFGDLDPDSTASNADAPFLLTAHDLTPPGHVAKIRLIIHADGDSADFDDTLDYTYQIGTPPPPTVLWEEDFEYEGGIDSFLIYWEVTGNWQRTTNEYHSPSHSAYSGDLVNGWTYLTLKDWISLPDINQTLTLDWWQKYNWDDGFWGQYQMQYDKGNGWRLGWEWDWTTDPDQKDWHELSVDIGKLDSLKIRFRLQSDDFFQNFNDWWIDDIKITTPTDNEPPYFRRRTVWHDTSYTGPFPVQAKITDVNGVDSAWVYYRVNNGPWIKIPMTPTGNNWYEAEIPAQSLNDQIDYYYWARDKWIEPNEGGDPIGAPAYGYYSFTITSVKISENTVIFPRISVFNAGKLNLRLILPKTTKADIKVYDPAGRKVINIYKGSLRKGSHRFVVDSRRLSSNVYFLKVKLGEKKKLYKFIIVK